MDKFDERSVGRGLAPAASAPNVLPKRKHPRLKHYDYAQGGYYHVVISTKNNQPILSTVGRGYASTAVEVTLTDIGQECKEQLFALETRYSTVKIDQYMIMPTHIHVMIAMDGGTAGASPRPTLSQVIGTFKSLTTRICNQKDNVQGRVIFQTSFYDTVIRNHQDYLATWQYIQTNPYGWEQQEELK
ncbi:transposase [Bengtsoniella intestinalis]|uniref:transposase n=1 Tax=Bengtsoniella intestinalis TaxID=3073143 RepID=UPI00391F1FC8